MYDSTLCAAESAPATLDQLEDEITTLAAHLGAAEHRWLTAVGEFDARGGWAGIGIASCAHWLNWKCGVSLPAAHERVRIARALRNLPAISAAMACGQLSYSKVRAITRVATAANETSLVRLARQGTASHIEEIVRRYRCVLRADDAAAAAKIQRDREVRYRWAEDGTFVLNARLPPEQGALVLKALQAATDAIRSAARDEDSSAEDSPNPNAVHAPEQSFAARRADALVLMAETALNHGVAELSPPDRTHVVIHVDTETLAGSGAEDRCELEQAPTLAVETARRLACDASLVTILETRDGTPLDVGRKTRTVHTALRRALQSRDRGCRFPGCTNKRFVDAHHIQHWANGGETKLGNLVLLCGVHHRLVHEEGFAVERRGTGFVFRTPDGKRVQDAPPQRVLAADPVLALMRSQAELRITPRTSVPEWMGERPEYDWITDALWRREHVGSQLASRKG